MRNQKGHLALAIVVLLFAPLMIAACLDTYVGGPTQVQGNQQGGSGATPAPGTSSKGPVVSVEIKGIVGGEHCQDGATPANESHTIGLGCYLDVTVNPEDASHAVIFDTSVTGLAPDVFSEVGESNAAVFVQSAGNAFNGRVTATAKGTIVLRAAVKGIPAPDTTFTVR